MQQTSWTTVGIVAAPDVVPDRQRLITEARGVMVPTSLVPRDCTRVQVQCSVPTGNTKCSDLDLLNTANPNITVTNISRTEVPCTCGTVYDPTAMWVDFAHPLSNAIQGRLCIALRVDTGEWTPFTAVAQVVTLEDQKTRAVVLGFFVASVILLIFLAPYVAKKRDLWLRHDAWRREQQQLVASHEDTRLLEQLQVAPRQPQTKQPFQPSQLPPQSKQAPPRPQPKQPLSPSQLKV
ncbi:MAG: hypothetical protein MHM6MM_005312 [Cercozoa sp. M6MM]